MVGRATMPALPPHLRHQGCHQRQEHKHNHEAKARSRFLGLRASLEPRGRSFRSCDFWFRSLKFGLKFREMGEIPYRRIVFACRFAGRMPKSETRSFIRISCNQTLRNFGHPVFFFRSHRGQNQFGEKIQATNVAVVEAVRFGREGFQQANCAPRRSDSIER